MVQVPCLASQAADRAYFAPDAGDAYEEFVANLSDNEFDEAAEELAAKWYPRSHESWGPAQWALFKLKHADAITEHAWERAE